MTNGTKRTLIEIWHNRDGIENWGGNYFSIFRYAEKNEIKPVSYCTLKVKPIPGGLKTQMWYVTLQKF